MDPLELGTLITRRRTDATGRELVKTRILPPPGGDRGRTHTAERGTEQGTLNRIELTDDPEAPGARLASSQWRYVDTGAPECWYALWPAGDHAPGLWRCGCPSPRAACAHVLAQAAAEAEAEAARLPVYATVAPERLLARIAHAEQRRRQGAAAYADGDTP